jgi:hypothetical protein
MVREEHKSGMSVTWRAWGQVKLRWMGDIVTSIRNDVRVREVNQRRETPRKKEGNTGIIKTMRDGWEIMVWGHPPRCGVGGLQKCTPSNRAGRCTIR